LLYINRYYFKSSLSSFSVYLFILAALGFEFSFTLTRQALYCLSHASSQSLSWLSRSFLGLGRVLGFELRALGLLGRCSTTWATLPALFVGIFEMGSHKLFSQTDFKPWSS
jgi:hypothetical protein